MPLPAADTVFPVPPIDIGLGCDGDSVTLIPLAAATAGILIARSRPGIRRYPQIRSM